MTIRNVLVPTDLSPCAERAFVPAAALALHHGATLTVVQVTTDPWAPALGRVTRTDGPEVGDEALELVPVVEVEVEASDVATALLDQASRTRADLVVMGTHGRGGFTRARMGSVAEAVARAAPCPVLLVRDDAAVEGWGLERVLVAVDPAELDPGHVPDPVRWAAALAASSGAPLDLVAVATGATLEPYVSLRRCAAGLLALTLRVAQSDAAPPRVDYIVRQGDAADEVAAEAERSGADLVVVGTRGRRGLRRLVIGSVAEEVGRSAPCPVLFVPPAASAPGPPEEGQDRAPAVARRTADPALPA